MTNNSNRIQWIDFARGFTIFLVIVAHSVIKLSVFPIYNHIYLLKMLTLILFTVIMPCFFAISGFLYKPIKTLHSYIYMLYKKIVSLGIPYIIFSILYVFMQHISFNNITIFHPYSSLLKIYSTPIDYLWFLYALFLMFVIIGLFDLMHLNYLIQFMLCILMMSISIIYPKNLSSGVKFTFNDIVFFYLGFILSILLKKNTKYFRKLFYSYRSTIFLTILLMSLLFVRLYIHDFNNSTTFISILPRIISILLLIQISIVMPHNKFFSYFDKYGKYTLIIYLVHEPIVSITKGLFVKLFSISNILNIYLLLFILIIISWIVSIVICHLSENSKILNFVFYPRKRYISKWLSKLTIGKWLFDINKN